jgi:hypothetical protein
MDFSNMLGKSPLWYEITPKALGLKWGLSRDECFERLESNPSTFRDSMTLLFTEMEQLYAIKCSVFVSNAFWESGVEVVEEAERKFFLNYEEIKQACLDYFGRADFVGTWEAMGFLENLLASDIAYWNLPEGRLQVEYEHSDRELPIIIWLGWYR